jgi:hypothetical protein
MRITYFMLCAFLSRDKWVSVAMTGRPRVADGRDGLQIWRVAESKLKKQ